LAVDLCKSGTDLILQERAAGFELMKNSVADFSGFVADFDWVYIRNTNFLKEGL